jgi:hypothetical protein
MAALIGAQELSALAAIADDIDSPAERFRRSQKQVDQQPLLCHADMNSG